MPDAVRHLLIDILPVTLVGEDGGVLSSDAVQAAREVADRLGLDVGECVVLRETRSVVLHLAPAPVLARVWPAGQRDLRTVRREVAITGDLATRGAAVAPPLDRRIAEPGPYAAHGCELTLWDLVDHDAARPLDARAAGRALREIHDLLADRDEPDLPHFVRLDEVRRLLPTLDVLPEEAEGLAEMLALAEQRVARLDVPLQPVHGDAWLGNLLRAPGGPLWSDFELVCLGPRELDLACNEGAARHRGRRQEDDDFLTGYGRHDRDILAEALVLELVPLTVWTYQLAQVSGQPRALDLARTRLDWALAGLRTRPRG